MNVTDILRIVENPSQSHYDEQAAILYHSCRSSDYSTIQHVRKYHPDPDKLANLNKADTNFNMDDARLILAREHGFEDWGKFIAHINNLSDPASLVSCFEKAADAVTAGQPETLRSLIDQKPGIVHARSDRIHGASLLHYIAANGVEEFRQCVPENALEIAGILLDAGALPDAPAEMYGSGHATALELLVSSAYPARAGLQQDLARLLLDHGAAIEGIAGDGSPLLAALASGYTSAAELLAARGALVDTIVTAAALGLADQTASFFQEKVLKPDMPLIRAAWVPVEPLPEAHAALAFVWAGMHNRVEILELMLDRGVSAASKDYRGWTALHCAAYNGHPEATRFLIAKKAPLEAHNEFGGTVLDQTLWATVHEDIRDGHIEIINMLLKAKARIHAWWLLTDLHPPLDERIAAILREYQA